MSQATQEQLNKFVTLVDKFMAEYARLISKPVADQVYATKDPKLIAEYENTVILAGRVRGSILATTGAWKNAKSAYQRITGKTSTIIGDAIDEIRSWFGRDPAPGIGGYQWTDGGALNGLGVVQIPAAAVGAVFIASTIAAVVGARGAIARFFTSLEASRIQKQNPDISREDALRRAGEIYGKDGLFGSGISWPMIGAALLAAYVLLEKK